jgi:DNA-binding XRE family transcriptional regulator
LTLPSIIVHFAFDLKRLRDFAMKTRNNVKKIREERLLSKSELARMAGVSAATIERIERGEECRLETKRKIILALGFSIAERDAVFQD